MLRKQQSEIDIFLKELLALVNQSDEDEKIGNQLLTSLDQVVLDEIKSLTAATCKKVKEIIPSEIRHKLTEKIMD